MTLFKKVFQTQARPATEEEALDDTELRRAFLETQVSEPMNLDPFGPVQDEDETPLAAAEEGLVDPSSGADTTLYEEDYFDHESDVASDTDDPESDVSEMSPHQEDKGGLRVSDDEVDAAPEGNTDQTDLEIAAFLDRAMATPMEEPVQSHQLSEPETVGDCEMYPSGVSEQDLCDSSAEEVEMGDSVQVADIGSVAEEHVGDFAREQMALLGTNNAEAQTETAPKQSAEIDLSAGVELDAMPAPASGRAARRAGRVKTRLLGFNRGGETESDPFDQAPETTASAQSEKFPVGWLVIVEGPGVGHAFSLFSGASVIGRGEDQVIRLDFGDNSISRQNHAAIAFDEEQNKFYIGHGGKSNIIRRNARPVLSTEELQHADLIRIGETTLRFVALCGSDFQWNAAGGPHADAV